MEDAALAGANGAAVVAGGASVVLVGVCGCIALRMRYTPAITIAARTIIARIQLPYDACFFLVALRFTVLPVSQ
jgi:hypothetical protein